jgi:hypothetical protein
MIKDQLRELRVRLYQMEQVARVIPTECWPDAFDGVLQGWEIRAGMAAREPTENWIKVPENWGAPSGVRVGQDTR